MEQEKEVNKKEVEEVEEEEEVEEVEQEETQPFNAEFLLRAEPETASVLRQVRCPTNAKADYKKYSSIPFIAETLIPEALGYVTGSLFTGRGQQNADKLLDRFGFSGSLNERVTGYNYFYKTNSTCPNNSFSDSNDAEADFENSGDKKCAGQPRYVYVRNVPTMSQKGIMSGGLLEDGKDLVATDAMNAFYYGRTKFAGPCSERKLPVGSALDDVSRRYKDREDFLKQSRSCIQKKCSKLSDNEKANCEKDCLMGHWIEKHCVSDPQKYFYGNKEYFSQEYDEYDNDNKNNKDIKDDEDNTSLFSFLKQIQLLSLSSPKQGMWYFLGFFFGVLSVFILMTFLYCVF